MRYVALSLFALVAGLCVVSRAEDCEEKTCCKQAAASSKSACPLSACAAKGDCQASACAQAADCAASACAKKSGCQASACAAKGACQATACAKSGDCCAAKKIAHLKQALDHLEAAGMEAEARQVKQALAWETIAQKQRELARLHAEIQELRQAAGPERQVALHVKVMEVSLTNMHTLGLQIPAGNKACDECPAPAQKCEGRAKAIALHVCDQRDAKKFVEKLEQADSGKVIAAPTVVTVEGRPCTYATECKLAKTATGECVNAVAGTQIDAEVVKVADGKLRLKVQHFAVVEPSETNCPDEQPKRLQSIATVCDIKPGQTLIVGGPIQERIETDGSNHVQRIMLVTPEEVTAQPPLPTAQAPSETEAK